jgi:hypothetical protein
MEEGGKLCTMMASLRASRRAFLFWSSSDGFLANCVSISSSQLITPTEQMASTECSFTRSTVGCAAAAAVCLLATALVAVAVALDTPPEAACLKQRDRDRTIGRGVRQALHCPGKESTPT